MHGCQPMTDSLDSFGPCPLSSFKPGVELSALPGAFAYRAGGNTEKIGHSLDLGHKLLGFGDHASQCNVIFHTTQRETSQAHQGCGSGKFLSMDESRTFRENLLRIMAEKGLKEAELSKLAGLNARAVTDIREERTRSPKLSTVFALAKALDEDPGVMMGLGRRYSLNAELAAFLAQYDESDQARFLAALTALPR